MQSVFFLLHVRDRFVRSIKFLLGVLCFGLCLAESHTLICKLFDELGDSLVFGLFLLCLFLSLSLELGFLALQRLIEPFEPHDLTLDTHELAIGLS